MSSKRRFLQYVLFDFSAINVNASSVPHQIRSPLPWDCSHSVKTFSILYLNTRIRRGDKVPLHIIAFPYFLTFSTRSNIYKFLTFFLFISRLWTWYSNGKNFRIYIRKRLCAVRIPNSLENNKFKLNISVRVWKNSWTFKKILKFPYVKRIKCHFWSAHFYSTCFNVIK